MQYMHNLFIHNQEFIGDIQGYSLCLLANQPKLQLKPFTCKLARTSFTSEPLVGTIVRFKVGPSNGQLVLHHFRLNASAVSFKGPPVLK